MKRRLLAPCTPFRRSVHSQIAISNSDVMASPAAAAPRPALIRPRASRSHSQLGAVSLSSDNSAATASSRRRRDFVFVVNPSGANGRTGKQWTQLLPHLRTRLADQCNICECITSGPSDAIDVTREAIKDGADAVIAVGGDGTLHEVVNGFFWNGSPVRALDRGPDHLTTLGLIPLGTGSDFARTFGWSNDPHHAIDRVVRGVKSKLDIGMMEGPNGDPHFFVNVADIHLSAKAGYFASMYKRFGNLCYVLGALRGFWGHDNRDMLIKVNGGDWRTVDKVTALCVGNAKYFGGGMKITPTVDPFSGDLEIVILQNFKWYDFLLKLHRLYGGTHLPVNGVSSMRVQSIEVVEAVPNGDVFVQSDGEHFGFLPTKFSVLPGAIDFFC